MLAGLYAHWNAKHNLVSRNDLPHLYEKHVLHSLAIARFVQFGSADLVMDLGTGGGFPGIPLAIAFPQTPFTLVDATGKKVTAVRAIAEAAGLKNVMAVHSRAESVQGKFDFIVSRATAPMEKLVEWTRGKWRFSRNHRPGGLLCLKGGNLDKELVPWQEKVRVREVSDYFEGEYFKEKKVVFLPAKEARLPR